MATAMVASDPAQALDFADRHLTGRTLSGFLRRAANQLSSSNPEAAEMFRSRLPPAYEVDSRDESQESGEP